MRIISLYDANLLPLEQVGGPTIDNPATTVTARVDKEGNVLKSVDGPDLAIRNMPTIPEGLKRKLLRWRLDNETDRQRMENKTECPFQVPVIYVCCSEEIRRKVDKGEGSRRFSVPYGNPEKICSM